MPGIGTRAARCSNERDRRRRARARSWRIACLLAGLAALPGCTTVSGSIGGTVGLFAREHLAHMPGAAAVAAIPYPQMYVRTPSGQGVFVLGNLDGQREAWYGREGVVLFLRHGEVVMTAGLPDNLAGVLQPAGTPFAHGLQHLSAPAAWTRSEDFSPGYRYGVPVTVRLRPRGETTLAILGKVHRVIEIEQDLDAPAAHWHATNRYWVDARNGLVWKSVQQVAPGETLTLVLLKPYAGDAR
jgi:hypothetical protein